MVEDILHHQKDVPNPQKNGHVYHLLSTGAGFRNHHTVVYIILYCWMETHQKLYNCTIKLIFIALLILFIVQPAKQHAKHRHRILPEKLRPCPKDCPGMFLAEGDGQ